MERDNARAAKTTAERGFSSAEIFEAFAEATAWSSADVSEIRTGYQRKVVDWVTFRLTHGSPAQRKAWFTANRAYRRVYEREYWRAPDNRARARARGTRKRVAEKADPTRHAKRLASWAAYRCRQKAKREAL